MTNALWILIEDSDVANAFKLGANATATLSTNVIYDLLESSASFTWDIFKAELFLWASW